MSRGVVRDSSLIARLWPYIRRQGKIFFAALLLLPVLAGAQGIQPLIVKNAIDGLLAGNSSSLPLYIAVLVGALVVSLALSSAQGYLLQKAGQNLTADLRASLFSHVLSLSSAYFSRTPVGKLITRLTSDVEALGDVFSTGAVGILSDLFSIVVVVGFMLVLRWDLALVLAGLLIPISFMVLFFQQRYRKANFRVREELSSLNAVLQENILGINIVQMFRREARNAAQFDQVNQRYRRAIDETIFYDSAISAVMEWIGLIAIATLLWFGGGEVLQKTITYGTLVAFIQYAQRLFDPIRQITEKFTVVQAGLTAIERIGAILDEPVEIRDPAQPKALPQTIRGAIVFEKVSLAYKDDDYVLEDISFTIRPGEKVALVGPTGAGKSSIIRLLGRLYEPTQGRILVDGIDIRELTQQDLRQAIGVVLQEGFMFSGDVASNLALGEDYPLSAIEAAARLMNVDSFIQNLPQGYQTPVRERGSNLSTGQKQLLAFARIALRDPKVLVLDEATASLDVGTEAQVQQALDQLLLERTAIIIAHRLSTIRNVDRILVLKRGQLVEAGNHEQLLAQNGVYATLYRLQELGEQTPRLQRVQE
ncbi:ABC transporter ATP-binding protein [Anthocerotibacter panamensis]|uniref:ABC transporter ATP-binding protein n=1 Tax=Anthocerotibacter panamensis TaxID=2857077 RepID=UPI001C402CEF|nr:ABC transporter ATP-binding protein [Anthocerotibacter panamensis]